MIIFHLHLLKNTKIRGITIFPFVFLRSAKDKRDKTLINHEMIHIRQQMEMLIIFFYIWYLAEFFYWYLRLNDADLAYRYISFEREAYAMEDDLNYLRKRKIFSFWKYIGN